MLYYFGKIVLAPFALLFFRPKVVGFKHLCQRGKVIYVCNHFSMGDPIFASIVIPRIVRFLAKASLFGSRLGKLLFKSLLVYPVQSGTADRKAIKHALSVLDKGQAFGIFPEGHRSACRQLDKIEKGAAFIAVKSGAPIVPMFIDPNTLKRLRIRMAVGEPIYPEKQAQANAAAKPVEAVTDAILDAFVTLRATVEAM